MPFKKSLSPVLFLFCCLAVLVLFTPFFGIRTRRASPDESRSDARSKRTLLDAVRDNRGFFDCRLYENETSLFEPLNWLGIESLCSQPPYRKVLSMRVHPVYWANYERYSDRTGIIDEAYVSFVFGFKYVSLMNLALETASLFSERPIVLFVSKLSSPVEKLFPVHSFRRLIVIEMDTMGLLPFWFDKLFAAVIAPVRRGVMLEADSLITWNTDRLFRILEHFQQETYPLLPGHPDVRWPDCQMYKGLKDCSSPLKYALTNRSMDYVHAHGLTWTSASRPFLTKILSVCSKDPADGPAGCQDDELALNYALWSARATRQYCVTDPFYTTIDEWQAFDTEALRQKYKNRTISFLFMHGSKEELYSRPLVLRIHSMKDQPWLLTDDGEWLSKPEGVVRSEGCIT